MDKDIIRINNLSFSYKNVPVFEGLSLNVEKNSFTTIVGSNKSGKTTLIKLITGILPSKDAIEINANKKQVGVFVGDIVDQFLFDDVYHELAFTMENLCYPESVIKERIAEVTNLLKIDDLVDKKIESLSTAEKARVLFAVSIIHKPTLLLLDNPFSMLSKDDRMFMNNIIMKLVKREHMTVLMTSNDLADSLYADYLYVLDDGKVIVEGPPLKVMQEDTLLNRYNISIPFMVDLSNKLMFYNLLDDVIVDMDRMVDKLWK